MEKLIELANQFELEREKGIESFKNNKLPLWKWYVDTFGNLCYESEKDFNGEDCYGDTAIAVLISQHYGFIKWLVEKNKVDDYFIEKIYRYVSYNVGSSDGMIVTGRYENYDECSTYESLIMQLAISTNPIEALLCILK